MELSLSAGGVEAVLLVTNDRSPARGWNSVFNEDRALSYDGSRHGKIPRELVAA